MNNQFVFEGRQKTVLLAFMALGVVCLGITYISEPMRFWSNYFQNTILFLGMSFVALFVLSAFTLAYAGWHTVMKRVWEAFSLFMPVGLLLLLPVILGIWTHGHHMYHWTMEGIADPASANYDRILAGKVGFLNKYWYTGGSIVFVLAWSFFAFRMRSLSLKEDREGTTEYNIHQQIKKYAAIFLPIGAFTSAAMIWQWVMSIDGHWYSTLYAWYCTASWFVAMMSLTIVLLIYLKSKGYYEQVTSEHLHDLGKYLFAFSIFWTYLWFSQFMLIWYGNNGEETIYFHTRRNQYTVLYFGNLILNFVTPFFVLMRNDTKRKYGTMAFAAIVCFFGHWWDYFYMVKPGVLTNYEHSDHAGGHGHGAADHGAGHVAEHGGHAAEHVSTFVDGFTVPGLLEVGTMLGFLALFIFFVFTQLSRASLIPKNDPYLEESLHHHT